MLARILAQSEAGNVFGRARAAAEAELELVRARAVMEAVLARAGNTAEWNGGPEQGAALILTSFPRCRGSNAMSVGHSPNEGERYGISELGRAARKTKCVTA